MQIDPLRPAAASRLEHFLKEFGRFWAAEEKPDEAAEAGDVVASSM